MTGALAHALAYHGDGRIQKEDCCRIESIFEQNLSISALKKQWRKKSYQRRICRPHMLL